MNEREKYIADLASCLGQLTEDERSDALEFYDEYIADAGLESRQAIEDKLGTPRQLSHKILADYSIKSNNQSQEKEHVGSVHSSWRVFWWVLAAIVTSPLTFILGILVLVVLITAAAVALGLVAGAIGAIVGIAAGAVMSLYAGCAVILSAPFTGLFYLGIGLSLFGLAFVCLPLLYWFIRLIAQGIANLAKFLYRKIQARREQ
jgi:uncharacterized membrane protein